MAAFGLRRLAASAAFVVLALGQSALAAPPSQGHAPDAAGAIREIAGRTLAVLQNANLDTGARQRRLEAVLSDGLDLEAIADFALGRHRSRLDPAQRAAFRNTFADYVVASYARRISRRAPEGVEVVASRQVTPRTAAVSTRTRKADGGQMVWTWRLLKRDSRYRIVDLQMAGVSLAVAYRSRIGATMSKRGFEAVMTELQSHLRQGTAMRAEQIALFQLLGLRPSGAEAWAALSE